MINLLPFKKYIILVVVFLLFFLKIGCDRKKINDLKNKNNELIINNINYNKNKYKLDTIYSYTENVDVDVIKNSNSKDYRYLKSNLKGVKTKDVKDIAIIKFKVDTVFRYRDTTYNKNDRDSCFIFIDEFNFIETCFLDDEITNTINIENELNVIWFEDKVIRKQNLNWIEKKFKFLLKKDVIVKIKVDNSNKLIKLENKEFLHILK